MLVKRVKEKDRKSLSDVFKKTTSESQLSETFSNCRVRCVDVRKRNCANSEARTHRTLRVVSLPPRYPVSLSSGEAVPLLAVPS